MSTDDLRIAWENVGYQFCRFDAEALRLSPYSFEGPIGYENLLAVKDFDAVNRRLEDADDTKRRVAKEIVNRCGTAKNHFGQCMASKAEVLKALAESKEKYRTLKIKTSARKLSTL